MSVNHCVVDNRKERPPQLFMRDAASISHVKTSSIISMGDRHFLVKYFIDSLSIRHLMCISGYARISIKRPEMEY